MKVPKVRQLPSGAWTCQLRIDGQSISITDFDHDVVLAKAYAYKAGVLKARRAPEAITLKTACERHIRRKEAERRSPSTIQGYQVIVENRYPDLMKMQLTSITPKVFERETRREMLRVSPRTGKPLSAKTIKNAYSFIVEVLREYMPDEHFSVELPEVKPKPTRVLTPEEIIPVIRGTSVELPCLLAMWLSLSMSEIRGLTKSQSLHNGQLTIYETVVDIAGKPVRKEGGKEELRVRTLDVPPYIQRLIDQVDGDVIVPLSAQAIAKRFYRLLEKAGLPHIKFHALRHINASVMAALNIHQICVDLYQMQIQLLYIREQLSRMRSIHLLSTSIQGIVQNIRYLIRTSGKMIILISLYLI